MGKKKKKLYCRGDRLNIYLNSDIPDHFLDWINNQSNASATLLYGASLLFKQYGNIDIASVMPARIDYTKEATKAPQTDIANQLVSKSVLPLSGYSEDINEPEPKKEEEHPSTWAGIGIEDLEDDPYS
ncbi:hypothetical protein [Paenibacillus larvae]|uniref:Uncharacterized protein n=1 Tax=Paenibacillus larvae subsp. larvae TaxID=147375 RepID=A0A6C0QZQ2_9BACL|nr:hypothetical protein [Paenibacillus larvae]QHZ54173.1 hypothetical protein ERICV_05190 [Paenibacillus larvae subsp. larvae]